MLQEIVPIIPLDYISEVIPAIIRPYLYTQGEEKKYATYMQLCTKLRTIHQSDACIQSIVRDTFDNGPPDHAFPTAIAFCALPDLLESERTACLHESGTLLRFYYGDDVWHKACDTITQSYRMACLGH